MNKRLVSKALAAAERIAPRVIEIKNIIGANPEIGLAEYKTSRLAAEFLETHGFSISSPLAGLETALRAEFGECGHGPVPALIGELDALPELGHACGHNIGCAAALGASAVLAEVFPDRQKRIVFIGAPAEEIGVGKIRMIERGVFDDIDAALMVHASRNRQVIKNFYGLTKIEFIFTGRSSHAAAYPEDGINALDAVILLFNSVALLRQQLVDSVRVHGIITDGGAAPNIIPERAAASFYIRADEPELMRETAEKVIACARGAATSTGARLKTVRDKRPYQPFKVLRSFYQLYSESLKTLGLEEHNGDPNRNKGSTDAGNLSRTIPTIHPHVPIPAKGGIHTREFLEAAIGPQSDGACVEGMKALALTAARIYDNPTLLKKINEEFDSK